MCGPYLKDHGMYETIHRHVKLPKWPPHVSLLKMMK